MKAILIAPLLVLASARLAKAQDIPPLPPLRGDAANLVDTMKFIQEKLPGKVNFMVYIHDNVAGTDYPAIRGSFELTAVSADAGHCSVGFHGTIARDASITEKDGQIFLKQVQDISLAQLDTVVQREQARTGHPERNVKVDPPITLVVVKIAPNKSTPNQSAIISQFSFYEEALSERVSKALQHAVSLCGGGKPETF